MAKLRHVHKWWLDKFSVAAAECECGATLRPEQIQSRINAVEKFSIQDAIQIQWDLEHAAGIAVGDEFEALEDYVAELDR